MSKLHHATEPSVDDFLTTRQAAELGYAGYSTLRRYIADGRLSASRVGGRIRIRRADLDALLEPARPDGVSPAVQEWIDDALSSAPSLTPAEAAVVARRIVKASATA